MKEDKCTCNQTKTDNSPADSIPCDFCLMQDDDLEFEPCSRCDGHAACEDFGCAFTNGNGHLVKTEPGIDY